MDQALANTTILDLSTGIPGPYCGRLLADFGARVIKTEPPSGDPVRRTGPFPGDIPHPERSGIFSHLNANKLGITLNLDCATGQHVLRQLARTSDIIVEAFTPGYLEERGLGYEALAKANPGLVLTSVTPFGQSGPYSRYKAGDITIDAMGGAMHSRGHPDREPQTMAPNVVLYPGGMHAALASVAAFSQARETGLGQHLDISLMEVLSSAGDDQCLRGLVNYQFTGECSQRTVMGVRGFPMGIYPCRDGYVHFWGADRWRETVAMLEMPELLADPRFQRDTQSLPGHREAFDEIFVPWCMGRTKRQIWEEAMKARVFCAPLNTTLDILADPHFLARGAWASAAHPALGVVTMPGRPFIMGGTPWRLDRPAPLLGEHNVQVFGELGFSHADVVRLRAAGAI